MCGRSLGKAEVVKGIRTKEVRGLPAAPSLVNNRPQVLAPGVVRVKDKPLHRVCYLAVVHPKKRVGEHAPANHDRSTLRVKVADDLPHLGGELEAGIEVHDLALHPKQVIKNQGELKRPNPILGSNKIGLFVTDGDQDLLDLGMRGHQLGGVVLELEPGAERLQGPV